MKKTSEALAKAQDEAQAFRQKLEKGRVRLLPDEPHPEPPKQKDEADVTQS